MCNKIVKGLLAFFFIYVVVILVGGFTSFQLYWRYSCGPGEWSDPMIAFVHGALYASLPPVMFAYAVRLPPYGDVFMFQWWPEYYNSFKKDHERKCLGYTREQDYASVAKLNHFVRSNGLLSAEHLYCFKTAGAGRGTRNSGCFKGFDSFNPECFTDTGHLCNHPVYLYQFTVAQRITAYFDRVARLLVAKGQIYFSEKQMRTRSTLSRLEKWLVDFRIDRQKGPKTCEINVVWTPDGNFTRGHVECVCDSDAICRDSVYTSHRSIYDCCRPYGTESIIRWRN